MELQDEDYPRLAAEFIRAARKTAKKSIRGLALEAGVSASAIVRLERGDAPRGPTVDVMGRIAKACGLRLQFTFETLPPRPAGAPVNRAATRSPA